MNIVAKSKLLTKLPENYNYLLTSFEKVVINTWEGVKIYWH